MALVRRGAATIDNSMGFHRIRVLLKPGSAPLSTMFRRVMIEYHLTVNPDGGPSFNDVDPNSIYATYIGALAASGITGGCGGGNFCPDSPVNESTDGGLHYEGARTLLASEELLDPLAESRGQS